jgi:hypothetical protein
MPELITFPDATAVVLSAMEVLDVATRDRVPTDRDLLNDLLAEVNTFVLCRRVGGPSRDRVVDDASVTLEAWAPTPEVAHDLLQDARAVLHSLPGTVVDGVPVYQVQEFAGPAFLADPISDHPRYTLTASVSLRGSTTGS